MTVSIAPAPILGLPFGTLGASRPTRPVPEARWGYTPRGVSVPFPGHLRWRSRGGTRRSPPFREIVPAGDWPVSTDPIEGDREESRGPGLLFPSGRSLDSWPGPMQTPKPEAYFPHVQWPTEWPPEPGEGNQPPGLGLLG